MNSLFVNQLTTLDFSYLCPERGLVGETWLADVILTGDLNDEGMVFDFGQVKKEIKAMIDHSADHALLVPEHHPAITIEEHLNTHSVRLDMATGEQIICTGPSPAIVFMPIEAITPEHVAPILQQYILARLPDNITAMTLKLYGDSVPGAWFHYSHGLKKHQGNCQRIAHGHRSPLQVFINGEPRNDLALKQAALWQDIYLATDEDLREEYWHNNLLHYTFAYAATQGDFTLSIPATRCYLLNTDTTIELVARHLAQLIGCQTEQSQVQVIVNEGFCKGAMATSNRELPEGNSEKSAS